jgi:hypothetical protein
MRCLRVLIPFIAVITLVYCSDSRFLYEDSILYHPLVRMTTPFGPVGSSGSAVGPLEPIWSQYHLDAFLADKNGNEVIVILDSSLFTSNHVHSLQGTTRVLGLVVVDVGQDRNTTLAASSSSSSTIPPLWQYYPFPVIHVSDCLSIQRLIQPRLQSTWQTEMLSLQIEAHAGMLATETCLSRSLCDVSGSMSLTLEMLPPSAATPPSSTAPTLLLVTPLEGEGERGRGRGRGRGRDIDGDSPNPCLSPLFCPEKVPPPVGSVDAMVGAWKIVERIRSMTGWQSSRIASLHGLWLGGWGWNTSQEYLSSFPFLSWLLAQDGMQGSLHLQDREQDVDVRQQLAMIALWPEVETITEEQEQEEKKKPVACCVAVWPGYLLPLPAQALFPCPHLGELSPQDSHQWPQQVLHIHCPSSLSAEDMYQATYPYVQAAMGDAVDSSERPVFLASAEHQLLQRMQQPASLPRLARQLSRSGRELYAFMTRRLKQHDAMTNDAVTTDHWHVAGSSLRGIPFAAALPQIDSNGNPIVVTESRWTQHSVAFVKVAPAALAWLWGVAGLGISTLTMAVGFWLRYAKT